MGIKGGGTVGFQQWNGFGEKDPLFGYHGALSIETLEEDNAFAIYSQLGYHQRGSANRYTNIQVFGTTNFVSFTDQFVFNNLSLQLGGKKKMDYNDMKVFYAFGVRGDMNLSTNLEALAMQGNNLVYPDDFYVRRFTYGMTIGGGFEKMFSDLVGATVELSFSPDFNNQYQQPPIPNVTNPFTGNSYTIPENNIKNYTLELTIGLRLLRVVEYID